MTKKFSTIKTETPTRETLAATYKTINDTLDTGDISAAVAAWESARRKLGDWGALVHLHFEQDTQNAAYKAAMEYRDEIAPTITNHDTALKTKLLQHSNRKAVEAAVGSHALKMWEIDVTTFSPEIEPDLQEESKLGARYTELLSSAKVEIDGKVTNLSGLAPYAQSMDRNMRHEAAKARWRFFEDNGAEFDEIYDKMVKLRTKIAHKLGFKSFTELGYRRMGRVDYNEADVATYRDQVRLHVTPLIQRFFEKRRKEEGWDTLYAWDEAIIDPRGNVVPAGDEAFLRAQAQKMFEAMNGDLASFYKKMNEDGYMDLDNRPTKAPGGFCTSFPEFGMPYIYANFNGTHHDIDVFTHEMGHAFQNYSSQHFANLDYHWPTSESAEIHSMSLEHLAYPQIGLMVGDENVERYCHMHLIQSIAFLPYGVCVDHFQHEVYANPEATPAQRHEMWKKLAALYMPWSNWGDVAYAAKGGRWQGQGHIYGSPFYYIDYTLAECCALQFWVKSRADYAKAMKDYVALCAQGGSKSFLGLVESAGLTSPFKAGVLEEAVKAAESFLKL